MKSYKYCAAKSVLTNEKKAFVRAFVISWNTLEAYKVSHPGHTTNKNSLKVTATTVLQNPAVWNEVYTALKEKENPTKYDTYIMQRYDTAVKNTGMSPIEIYCIYAEMVNVDGEDEDTDTTMVEAEDTSAINVLYKLAHAFAFFTVVGRNYYLNGLKKAIKRELEYLEMLAKHNNEWYVEYNSLNKQTIKELGVNLTMIDRE